MELAVLKKIQNISSDVKLIRIYSQFELLLNELRKKKLSQSLIILINESVEEINNSTFTAARMTKLIKQKQTLIIKQAEKVNKIVPKSYYRTIWMLFGMSGIGIPIGVTYGLIIGNLAFLGLGLPIGMGIGIAIGSSLDKKAFNEGRQLDLEIKY